MASRYFGVNRGAQGEGVTEGSSTTSKDMEVVIDLTKNLTKAEVADKLEEIKNFIFTTSQYPPA